MNVNAFNFVIEQGEKKSPSRTMSTADGEQSQSSSKQSPTSEAGIDGEQNGRDQKEKMIVGLLNEATSSINDDNIGKAVSLLDEVLFNLQNNFTGLKPFSNSSIESLVSNGATISGKQIEDLDDLPPAQVQSSRVQVTDESTPPTIEFEKKVEPGFNPANIYEEFDLPTYHSPSNISEPFTYLPPTFRIMQETETDDNKTNEDYILATPIISNVQTNMNILMDNSITPKENQSSLEKIRLIPAKNGNNVGFSISIADNIANVLKIPAPPVNELALFLETGIVSGSENASSNVNSELNTDKTGTNSNSTLADDPSILLPEFSILVSKSLNSSMLLDGCPQVDFLYFNETSDDWNPASKPLRENSLDTFDKCGFVLKPEHNSKFAVGGVQPLL